MKKQYILFLVASAVIGITQSIDNSVFNNFLNDTYHLSVGQRTFLEIPREFPGFLVVFVSGILLFLGDVKIAAISNIIAAIGMLGLGFISKEYSTMILWLTLYSMGQHLFMPVSNSIGMNLFEGENMGKRLGQINAVNTAMFLLTSIITAVLFKYVKVNYAVAFAVGAVALIISATLLMNMKSHKAKNKSNKIVFRKEYKTFYILSILFGARKQIFITFGPWVLIKVFQQGVSTFALLGFFIAGIGIFVKPMIGIMIDKLGEKFVLKTEAIVLIVICLGYGFATKILGSLGAGNIAIIVVCACFVIDQVMAAAGMARATYLKKISISQEDVSPTLSMGISMDHVVSMIVPFLGGVVWQTLGYEYVFLGGALIAASNLFVASRMKINGI